MPPAVFAERWPLVLEQDLAEAVDAPQRRAQLGQVALERAIERVDLLEEAAMLEDDAGLIREELQQREIVFEERRALRDENAHHTDAARSHRDRRCQ
jgi:hypothetical protein